MVSKFTPKQESPFKVIEVIIQNLRIKKIDNTQVVNIDQVWTYENRTE